MGVANGCMYSHYTVPPGIPLFTDLTLNHSGRNFIGVSNLYTLANVVPIIIKHGPRRDKPAILALTELAECYSRYGFKKPFQLLHRQDMTDTKIYP